MKVSIKKGFSFGLTSGVITTLGLIVGLNSATDSRVIVFGSILLISVADALSDAMGMHMSEESGRENTHKEVWESTISTFLSKFLVSATFLVPVWFLELKTAVFTSVLWGLFLTIIFNYYIAKEQKLKPSHIILEHLAIATIVIFITYYLGLFVATLG